MKKKSAPKRVAPFTVVVGENGEGDSVVINGATEVCWSRTFSVSIYAKPIPQKQRGHNGRNFFDGSAADKKRLRKALSEEKKKMGIEGLMKGPLRLTATFYFEKSQEEQQEAGADADKVVPHVEPPDLDNLVKFVGDAMKGILIADDCQIYGMDLTKAKRKGDDKTVIWVREIVEDNMLM